MYEKAKTVEKEKAEGERGGRTEKPLGTGSEQYV